MQRKFILIIVILVLLIAGGSYGAYTLYQSARYVKTTNARISGALIPVGSLAAGQVISVNVQVGNHVDKGQKLAEVGTPRFSDTTTRQGLRSEPGTPTSVDSPISGYVAAVWTYPGAMVGPGAPVVTVYDPSNVWVTANIDEAQIGRVHPGQAAEVSVDSLGGKVLKGTVVGITPATAANFSLLPQDTSSSNFIKIGQVVPVRISLDSADGEFLIPGGSVEVKITR